MNSTPPPHGWHQTDADRSLLAELVDRLPERIADAHAHIYRTVHMHPVPDFVQPPGPADSGVEEWRAHTGTIVGGAERLDGALILPYPNRSSDTAEVNRFVVEATRGHDGIRAALLATPECDPDGVDALAEPAIGGFKVYWCYATGPGEPQQAAPSQFLPEWVWQQAHERGWFITLHLMRDAALADPVNQREVREHCERYPNARLVLAHAGRGFYAPNTVAGIASLAGLENVWFDTSAICEPEALVAILREFGPRRLLFGTDYPISHQRGRAISLGTDFAWVVTDRVEQWDFPDETPAQIGIEGIRAVLTAADLMNLDERDLTDIFHDNTMRLLGFQEDDPELGQRLFTRAKEFIPGGTQLQSKNPDNLAPGAWPPYFREAKGIDVWDESGRRFRDVGHHGIGAAALGYRDPDVTRAVMRRVALGSYSMLNSREEMEVAELLCDLHPWAEKVRYARSGGEICSIGARIARATTGRSLLAICGYHGWHDWYLAANVGGDDALDGHLATGLEPVGVPPELSGTNLTFHYGDIEAFDRLIADHGHRLAGVVMEPCRMHHPPPGFLEHVRAETRRVGALLVYDEVSLGWRLARGGAHLRYGVEPGPGDLRQVARQRPSDGRGDRLQCRHGGRVPVVHLQHLLDGGGRLRGRQGGAGEDDAHRSSHPLRAHRPPLPGGGAGRLGAARRAAGPRRRHRRAPARTLRARAVAGADDALHPPDAAARLPDQRRHVRVAAAHGRGDRRIRGGHGPRVRGDRRRPARR